MNEHFLTYEQSLAVKELGFDEPCLATHGYLDLYIGTDDGHVKAPLKSQFFKWVREKYNYDIHIRGTHFRAVYVIGIPLEINYNSKDGFPLVLDWEYIVQDNQSPTTYEQAENECINKIIEILKLK